MAAPNVTLQEIDLSTRVPGFPGVFGAIVIPAKKGPIDQPTLIDNEVQFLQLYTPNEKVEIGFDLAHFSALAYLQKSNRLWVQRAVPIDYLFGGVSIWTDASANPNNSFGVGEQDPTAHSFAGEEAVIIFGANPGDWNNSIAITIINARDSETVAFAGIDAGTDIITTTQNWKTGEQVIVQGNFLPTPFVNNGNYFVIALSATTIRLATSLANAQAAVAIDITFPSFSLVHSQINFTLSSFNVGMDIPTGTPLRVGTPTNVNWLVQPLVAASLVFAIRVNAFTIKVASTLANAQAGIAITLTAPFIETVLTGNINPTTNEFTVVNNYPTGSKVLLTSLGFPSQFVAGTTYFVINISPTVIQLASSLANALAAIPIDFDAFTASVTISRQFEVVFGPEVGLTLAPLILVREDNAFIINVYKDTNFNEILESWTVSRDPTAKDGFGNNLFIEDVLLQSNYIRGLSNSTISETVVVKGQGDPLLLAGGSDGSPVTDSNMITAVQVFANADDKPVTVLMDGGFTTPAYQSALITLVEPRQDSVAILSTPFSAEAAADYLNQIINYRNLTLNANSSFGALYTPHVQVTDKFNNITIFVAPDGYAAGAISFTALNFEMWFPVGGFKRGVLNVADVKRRFSRSEIDLLYDNGINPIRFIPGRGVVIWGQKTLLSRPSSLSRLNVRLLLIVLEPAIKVALEDFLFELNDESTRALVRSALNSFLGDVKARRGVTDFLVVCDGTNNSAQDVDNFTLNVWIFIKPTQAVEFIKAKLVITSQSTDFSLAAESL